MMMIRTRSTLPAGCVAHARVLLMVCLLILSGCASPPDSGIIQGPLGAVPLAPPPNLERVNTGAIFQPNMAITSLFSTDRRPSAIGDTLKIKISESLSASNKVNVDTSRDSKLSNKGPGAKAGLGIMSSIMNLDATASGSNSFKGDGTAENSSKFTGQLAVTVINVLPNGNLVVAGDRTIAMSGGVNVLRFSAIVNPRDIGVGNIVASADTVNARMELVGRGDVSDASTRNWIQRALSSSLSFW
jgi:flagellar L-ring protein FlgH